MSVFKSFALISAMALTVAFAPTPSAALDLDAMTDGERAAFRAEVRAYLLDNPEVLMEAIRVLETRDQQAQVAADVALAQANADALFNDGYSYVGGNPDGDITLVEFMDYRCGYCRQAFAEVEQLLELDGNIRFIVKEFPILGEQSMLAAQFAIATQQVAGDDAYKLQISSIKSMLGHMIGAACAVEMSTCCMSLATGILAPTINYETPDPDCDLNYIPNKAIEKQVKYAVNNSFGFGGHNVSLVIKKVEDEDLKRV